MIHAFVCLLTLLLGLAQAEAQVVSGAALPRYAGTSKTTTDYNGNTVYYQIPPNAVAIEIMLHGAASDSTAFSFSLAAESQLMVHALNAIGHGVIFVEWTSVATHASWCDPSQACSTASPVGGNADVYNIQRLLSTLATNGVIPANTPVVLNGMSDGAFAAPPFACGWAANEPANVGAVAAVISEHEQNQSEITNSCFQVPILFLISPNDSLIINVTSSTAPCCYLFIPSLSIASFVSYAKAYNKTATELIGEGCDPASLAVGTCPIVATPTMYSNYLTQRIPGLLATDGAAFIACLVNGINATGPWLNASGMYILDPFYNADGTHNAGWNYLTNPCGSYTATQNSHVSQEANLWYKEHEYSAASVASIVAWLHTLGL